MSVYGRWVFPTLCDLAMKDSELSALRFELLAEARGEALELGFGTGRNLPFYSSALDRLVALEPNPGMRRLALQRINGLAFEVMLVNGRAESLPFESGRFDVVVSTLTLCGIRPLARVIDETHRVLKPGGRFLFLEHGRNDDPRVATWQRRLSPLQQLVADGCRLDVDIEAAVRSPCFAEVTVERFVLDRSPRLLGSMYRGSAVKAAPA